MIKFVAVVFLENTFCKITFAIDRICISCEYLLILRYAGDGKDGRGLAVSWHICSAPNIWPKSC